MDFTTPKDRADAIRQDRLAAVAPAAVTPEAAAESLHHYVTVEERNPRKWGTKNSPNARIAELQKQMGGIKSKGYYGNETRRRGRQLTGKRFPARR